MHCRLPLRWDEDLGPLRADSGWKELKKRWKDEEHKHAEAHGAHVMDVG